MIIHDEIIRQFIQDQPMDNNAYAAYPTPPLQKQADPKRKDIVMELHSRILPILKEHTLYNHERCRQIEENYDAILNDIHVHLMVNAPAGYDIYPTTWENQHHIFIDLIQIADHTPIVTEMMYILLHHFSRICMRLCIKKRCPSIPDSYIQYLDHETFTEGFSLLMAWNEDIHTYPFSHSSYDLRKEHAFGYLSAFIQESDRNKQMEILKYLQQASFWETCTAISGMFYLFDIYQEQGIERLKSIYEKGYIGFISSIFSS